MPSFQPLGGGAQDECLIDVTHPYNSTKGSEKSCRRKPTQLSAACTQAASHHRALEDHHSTDPLPSSVQTASLAGGEPQAPVRTEAGGSPGPRLKARLKAHRSFPQLLSPQTAVLTANKQRNQEPGSRDCFTCRFYGAYSSALQTRGN